MLTKRDYWTITGLILVVAILFQLVNVARMDDGLDDARRDTQSAAAAPPMGDADR